MAVLTILNPRTGLPERIEVDNSTGNVMAFAPRTRMGRGASSAPSPAPTPAPELTAVPAASVALSARILAALGLSRVTEPMITEPSALPDEDDDGA